MSLNIYNVTLSSVQDRLEAANTLLSSDQMTTLCMDGTVSVTGWGGHIVLFMKYVRFKDDLWEVTLEVTRGKSFNKKFKGKGSSILVAVDRIIRDSVAPAIDRIT